MSRDQGPRESVEWAAPEPRAERLVSVTLNAEWFAHTRSTIRFLHTAACSRQSCFDTLLGCESLRDDIQVRADIGRQGNAHRTRWASLFDERHSKLASCEGRGARDAVGSHTREQPYHIVTYCERSNGNQFLMCQVSIAHCCYVRSLNASSKNYKVMQMSSERFYTRNNQKTIHNFNKL